MGSIVESGDILSISPNPDDDDDAEDDNEDEDDEYEDAEDRSEIEGERICSSADEPKMGK